MFGPRRGRYRGYTGGRGRDGYFMLLILQLATQVYNLPNKPPVTLAIMALNFLVHFRDFVLPVELARLVPNASEGCIQPHAIMSGEWGRLFWSAFIHLDDAHIYYNMASFLSKGLTLERSLGSRRFLFLVVELLLLSHGLMAGGCYYLGESSWDYRYLSRSMCAAGFSAVLFALKVVLTHDDPGTSTLSMLPISVPTKYAAWAELLLIHYLIPGTSFAGHLAGVIAGVLHVKFLHSHLIHWGRRLPRTHARQREPVSLWSEVTQWLSSLFSGPRRDWGGGTLGTHEERVAARTAHIATHATARAPQRPASGATATYGTSGMPSSTPQPRPSASTPTSESHTNSTQHTQCEHAPGAHSTPTPTDSAAGPTGYRFVGAGQGAQATGSGAGGASPARGPSAEELRQLRLRRFEKGVRR